MGFYFKMSPGERELIEKAMKVAGIHNMSGYIRKMAANGYIVKLDLPELADCSKLLRSAANNLNQIARRVNSGGGFYSHEIAEIQTSLHENRKLFGEILAGLAKLT